MKITATFSKESKSSKMLTELDVSGLKYRLEELALQYGLSTYEFHIEDEIHNISINVHHIEEEEEE